MKRGDDRFLTGCYYTRPAHVAIMSCTKQAGKDEKGPVKHSKAFMYYKPCCKCTAGTENKN